MSDDLDISGGATDVAAALDDIRAHSAMLAAASDTLVGLAGEVASVAGAGDLAQAAVLCPDVVAAAEARLAAASAGPTDGLLVVGTELAALAAGARWCAEAYAAADAGAAIAFEGLTAAAGFTAGVAAPLLAPVAVAGGVAVTTNPLLAGTLAWYAATGQAGDDVDELLASHPELLDTLLRMAPWMLDGLAGSLAAMGGVGGPLLLHQVTGGQLVSGSYEGVVAGLSAVGQRAGRLADSGRFSVQSTPVRTTPGAELTSARPMSQLIGQQAWMDSWVKGATPEETDRLRKAAGQVSIVQVEGERGQLSYVVHIPGTETWDTARGGNPVDLSTNVELMAHQRAQMTDLVAQAIRSQVPADAPVLLVGHSQGGITAASIAADPALVTELTIKGVVTVGSPIARFDIDRRVSVLSVEHSQDVVPLLDAAPNPDRSNWVTVRRDLAAPDPGAVGVAEGTCGPGDAPTGGSAPTLDGSHNLGTYQETADLIDASNDPAIQAWREANFRFFTGTATAAQYAIVPQGQ